MYHLAEETTNQKGSFVGKLSPHDASIEALLAKLGVAWLSYFVGLNLQEWLSLALTFASLVYVIFNTYVLIRDRVMRRRTESADFGKLSEGD